MDSIADLTREPTAVEVGGIVYQFHPLRMGDYGRLQKWVDAQFPDPFAVASRQIEQGRVVVRDGKETREPYTVAQQQFLLRTAMDMAVNASHPIGTPEADAKLMSPEGWAEVLLISVGRGDPAFTRADAAALFARMNEADRAAALHSTQAGAVVSDPKGPAGEPRRGATPGRTRPRKGPRRSTSGA